MLEKILQGMASLMGFFHDDRFLKFAGGVCFLAAGVMFFLPENSVPVKYLNTFLLMMNGYGVYSSTGRMKNGIPKSNNVPNNPDNINAP
ncbi:MAG: hypothetical protein V1784_07170 [bacterium]